MEHISEKKGEDQEWNPGESPTQPYWLNKYDHESFHNLLLSINKVT